jgi:hypothetical protein
LLHIDLLALLKLIIFIPMIRTSRIPTECRDNIVSADADRESHEVIFDVFRLTN